MRNNKNFWIILLLCLCLFACGGGSDNANSGGDTGSSITGEGSAEDDGDLDDDGYLSTESGGSDCNDEDANIYPSATEVCDGKDNDCNSSVDDINADTIYVPTDCENLTLATTAINNGGVIYVLPGTYDTFNAPLEKDYSLISVEGKDKTIIQGYDEIWTQANLVVDGFTLKIYRVTIQHESDPNKHVYILNSDIDGRNEMPIGIYLDDANLTLENVTVKNFRVGMETYYWSEANHVYLYNTKIIDNTSGAFRLDNSEMIGYNVVIAHNQAVIHGSSNPTGTVCIISFSDVSLYNSSIIENTAENNVIFGDYYSHFNLINSDFSYNTSGDVSNIQQITSNLNYTNVYGNTPAGYDPIATTTLGTMYSVEPGYIDISATQAADWNLTLLSSSPLINVGHPDILDWDGSVSDIGPYGGPLGNNW